uniref:SURP and G-patch domain containing 2 n=1 Tax=Varanus komodoensis TaxID=61221 RepID=A0A8D2L6A7_VARKO
SSQSVSEWGLLVGLSKKVSASLFKLSFFGFGEEDDSYYTKSYTQPSTRTRDYSQPPLRDREYGHSASLERNYSGSSSQDRDYARSASSRERDYSRLTSRESSRRREIDYESHELLSDFRSPGLLEENYGASSSQDYNAEHSLKSKREFTSALPAARGRGLQAKARDAAHSKGLLATPGKKWESRSESQADNPLVDPQDQPKPRTMPSPHPRQNLRTNQGTQRGSLLQQPVKPLAYSREKEPSLELVDPSDIFATFGIEIIKWAGFHEIKRDPEYSELFRVLFTLETETCAKMLASFKCSLKPEHQEFCLSSVRTLQHAALRTPKVDSQFLNMLLEKRVVLTKNCFFDVIKPFDRYVMRMQEYLLRSSTPLLMACNAYELSIKTSSFSSSAQMAAAFESTVSLCRKSLALLGQTFALASSFRQEKILEALSILESAPSPTLFPNFDTSALFGREYIEHLQSWLDTSGCQMHLKKAGASPPAQTQRNAAESRPKAKIYISCLLCFVSTVPQRADRKVVETIEKLVNAMISGMLKGKEKTDLNANPEYWFLHEEESLEYKYYKLKLSEMERLMTAASEGAKQKTPRQQTSDTVRVLLHARKVASIKKKLFRRKKPSLLQRAVRTRKMKTTTTGTQTQLSAGTMVKLPHSVKEVLENASSGRAAPAPPGPEEAQPLRDDSGPQGLPGRPESCPSLRVDPKTMETAQKLAEFVAEVGPEIEQFSIENSADNPDLWFLQDQQSSAFQFYRMKVRELCPSISFGTRPEPTLPTDVEEADDEEETATTGEETEEEPTAKAEAPPAAEGERASTVCGVAASVQTPLQVPPQGTPFRRKRVSSKSLKVGLIPASKRVCLIDEPKVHDPVRIAYDRPCGYSPYKNRKKSKDLEFQHKRLNQKNIGFQMLQKMGWQEGLGLGLHGKGITDPVKVYVLPSGEGLGVTGEEKKEDSFASFRQRMIQMYYLKRANK